MRSDRHLMYHYQGGGRGGRGGAHANLGELGGGGDKGRGGGEERGRYGGKRGNERACGK